jgi:4-hydroxybenzoate polyprenyltransferase
MGMAVTGAALTPSTAPLFFASALAYAGGMALNDAWDAPVDFHERPERPIPRGRITRGGAFRIAGACLAGCLLLAAAAGGEPFAVAVLLVVAIVLYDGFAKGSAFGPPVMAACRLLNAGLGAAAGALTPTASIPIALLFAYVLTLTVVSRFEVTRAPVTLVRGAAAAFVALLLGSAGLLLAHAGAAAATGVVLLAALALWLGGPLRAALTDPAPRRIIGVIKAAVLGIILLDAAFVAAARGPAPGLLVAALFVPAFVLGRRFASA